jgi:hypothetical protein
MIRLTVNQQGALKEMRGFRVVALLDTGAAIVVYMQRYQSAQVVDVDGRVYSLSHYLAIIPQRSHTFA